jgi:hypothetical protein
MITAPCARTQDEDMQMPTWPQIAFMVLIAFNALVHVVMAVIASQKVKDLMQRHHQKSEEATKKKLPKAGAPQRLTVGGSSGAPVQASAGIVGHHHVAVIGSGPPDPPSDQPPPPKKRFPILLPILSLGLSSSRMFREYCGGRWVRGMAITEDGPLYRWERDPLGTIELGEKQNGVTIVQIEEYPRREMS